jgi:hypothetical protein
MKLLLEQKTKVCEIKDNLPKQVTDVRLQTKTAGIMVPGACDHRKKVDDSDDLSDEQKGNLFHMLSKYRAHFTSKTGL